ncbi:MAG: hypothetical protein RR382_01150 [Tannerellaceae bacterium]
MNEKTDIKEISAEMLLNYLYPELENSWVAHYKGTFYRNYNEDVIELDTDNSNVTITRDGFVKLLPQGLITLDNELKKGDLKERAEALRRRKYLLDETFLPFDTFTFRNRLRIERQISDLLNQKIEFILKNYFYYDLSAETDKYVKELAVMLPYVSYLRGNLGFISDVLAGLLGYEVIINKGRYSSTDDTLSWLPQIRYEIIAENLEANEYKDLNKSIECLQAFIRKWLLPFDMHIEFLIKHHGQSFILGDKLTLDYNTEIKC